MCHREKRCDVERDRNYTICMLRELLLGYNVKLI